jgi:hypothetical protein
VPQSGAQAWSRQERKKSEKGANPLRENQRNRS